MVELIFNLQLDHLINFSFKWEKKKYIGTLNSFKINISKDKLYLELFNFYMNSYVKSNFCKVLLW